MRGLLMTRPCASIFWGGLIFSGMAFFSTPKGTLFGQLADPVIRQSNKEKSP
jgi:hypothetical protein